MLNKYIDKINKQKSTPQTVISKDGHFIGNFPPDTITSQSCRTQRDLMPFKSCKKHLKKTRGFCCLGPSFSLEKSVFK